MKLVPILLSLAAVATVAPSLHARPLQDSHTGVAINVPGHKYSFALVGKDGMISCWGDFNTVEFESLRKSTKEDTLYVRKDGAMYAITDRATINEAKADLEPMQKLGRQQGELGRQQGQLGAEQGKLGAKQGEYGRIIGELARKMSQDSRSGSSSSDARKQMEEISSHMKNLGEQQKALGEKQRALGHKQAELGHQQSQAANEAEIRITKLIDDAFARGLAHKQ